MNLHYTTGQPDWETVKAKNWNIWQRWAAATRGVATLPNVVSLIGLVIVLASLVALLNDRYWVGAVGLVLGRLCDLADGWLAELTGTKSPLGEVVDATFDKIGTLLTVVVFFVAELAPQGLLIALVIPQIIITLISLRAFARGNRFHPSPLGKISMAVAWLSMLVYAFEDALKISGSSFLGHIAWLFMAVAVVFNFYTLLDYIRRR